MGDWTEYVLALVLFAASHFLPRMGGMRDRLIARMGRRSYFMAYGLLSVGLLIWLIAAAGRAPYVQIWPQLPWTRWVPNLVMPLAFALIACGMGLPQRFTLGGRQGGRFDPADPGMAAVSRHPLFLSLALWSGAHLPPNGDLAHVILFGSFLAMAIAAILAFDAKARRVLGPEAAMFFSRTSILSVAPLVDPAWLRRNGQAVLSRAGIGLLAWFALLHLHGWLVGASPFPA